MKQFIKSKTKPAVVLGWRKSCQYKQWKQWAFQGCIIRILLTRSCLYFILPGIYSTESIIDYTFVTCLLDSQER